MHSLPARFAVSVLALLLASCGSPSSVDDGDDPPHDFDLTVRIGEAVVRDGGSADSDPATNRIVLRDYRPAGFGGELIVDDLLIEARMGANGAVRLATTVPAPEEDDESARIGMGTDGPTPFATVPLRVTGDLAGAFSGAPTEFESTVHLHGSYVAVDDSGAPQPGETISHARIEITGEMTEGSAADPRSRSLGTVAAETVQDEPAPVPFGPPDVIREISADAPSSIQADLLLELGPGDGATLPVSGEVMLRPVDGG